MLLARIAAIVCLAGLTTAVAAQAPSTDCGEIITIATHGDTTTSYVLSHPAGTQTGHAALALLVGREGFLEFDKRGCPRKRTDSSLVRSIPYFHSDGFSIGLIDAPSDRHSGDGLAGFRIARDHADDIGKVIADLRQRTGQPIWLVGTSRGTISAANAAARLTGAGAPDGLVLTSAIMSGGKSRRRPWASQTVFNLPLEAIHVPVLVVGHGGDKCIRTPAKLMPEITARTHGVREQIVTVTGGPGWTGRAGLEACEPLTPHGFIGQDEEVAAGIARFIDGGSY